MALSESDIFAACEALTAKGETVTQNKVREYLGGGSIATIAPALREWRGRQQGGSPKAVVPLPPAIEARLKGMAELLWEQAVQASEARMATERAAFEVEREELTRTADELATAADAARGQVAELHSAAAEALQTHEATRGQLEHARVQLAEAQTEAGSLRGLVSELREYTRRQELLVTSTAASAAAAKEDYARVGGQLAELQRQNTELMTALATGPGRAGK